MYPRRCRAAGALQPAAGAAGGPRQVLHHQGAAAGDGQRRRGREGRGGQLAGSHDPALQQRSLAGGRILSPGGHER